MANDSYSQQALAADLNFQIRVRACLGDVAWQVLEEDPATADHATRASYANAVIKNLTMTAQQVSPWLVMRPNLMAANTTYSFAAEATTTDATDAAIESQLMTDWNEMAGVGLSTTPASFAAGPQPPPPPVVATGTPHFPPPPVKA
jgi:hypothetical protein